MDDPRDSGALPVGDGHRIHWEDHGNPEGRPAIYLHGGPGGGLRRGIRELFDLDRYRLVLFDQRGCGGSTPLAEADDANLSCNTTHHLVADIELLRRHLGVDRWTILGLSWGTTLGLAYAQAHPACVQAAVLGLVTTTSRREVDWITEGVGRLFPLEWERFAAAVPERLRGHRLVDAYAELLFDADPRVRAGAAEAWCAWEDAHVSLSPGHRPNPRYRDPSFSLRLARLVTHYWRHAAFLEDDQLIRDAALLDGIPGVLIHGRHDVSSPPDTAVRLSRAWTTSELRIIEDAGHGGGGFGSAVTSALAELAH